MHRAPCEARESVPPPDRGVPGLTEFLTAPRFGPNVGCERVELVDCGKILSFKRDPEKGC